VDFFDQLVVVVTILTYLVLVAAAFGLSFWAYSALRDRAALVGLYIVFGFLAAMLALIGFAGILSGQGGLNLVPLALGVGLGLPLLPPVRRLFALLTPIDPTSAVDMIGLSLLLAITLVSAATQGSVAEMLIAANSGEGMDLSVSVPELIFQALLFLIFAYIAVGFWFARSLPEATARLGIGWPTWRTIGASLGFLAATLATVVVAGAIATAVQPDIGSGVDEAVREMTANVQNPVGAFVLGASAGIGEEALFRGALQPRLGIVLTSIAFTMIHAPQYGLNLILLGLFGVSVLLGLERRYFGTTAAMVTHALFNAIQVLLLSFQ
jgi:membrane protease YdiL (CAAX protease family)